MTSWHLNIPYKGWLSWSHESLSLISDDRQTLYLWKDYVKLPQAGTCKPPSLLQIIMIERSNCLVQTFSTHFHRFMSSKPQFWHRKFCTLFHVMLHVLNVMPLLTWKESEEAMQVAICWRHQPDPGNCDLFQHWGTRHRKEGSILRYFEELDF